MTKWFQCSEPESQGIVGRFIDVEVPDIAASKAAGKEVLKRVPALESKIPGSHDTSPQRVKPFNEAELKSRFPGAWEYYIENRDAEVSRDAVPVVEGLRGTPLHESDFIPRAKIPFLNELGFSTIEQVRDMSDSVAQNLKAMKWRQQAAEFLART